MATKWALLEGLGEAETRSLLSLAQRRRFAKGEVIFHEGDPGDTLHLIDRGHVAVRVTTPLGDVATLRVLGAGDFFGELAVISPAERNATVQALERTETLALYRDEIERLRTSQPTIDRFLLEAAIAEVRRLSAQLLEALYLPAPKRVLRRLCDLAVMYGGDNNATVDIPLTQDDIAGLAGTTRPTANQVLRAAQEDGLVELVRGRLSIVDLAGLTARAR